MWKKRVVAIRTIEPVISIGPAVDQAERTQDSQLFLNCSQGESAHQRQFPNITLRFRIREKQPQDLGSRFWEQQI
jgi:hypothetical protein